MVGPKELSVYLYGGSGSHTNRSALAADEEKYSSPSKQIQHSAGMQQIMETLQLSFPTSDRSASPRQADVIPLNVECI
jgi:hypothetical protein